MKEFSFSSSLEEKIYDLKVDDIKGIVRITTFFPLKPQEKNEIFKMIYESLEFSINFKSIFSDKISDEEWNNSKTQIKKKFQDELFKID